MNITVDQAIEMYARVLCAWKGVEAPADADLKARERRLYGDEEGYVVWSRVSQAAAAMLEDPASGKTPPRAMSASIL